MTVKRRCHKEAVPALRMKKYLHPFLQHIFREMNSQRCSYSMLEARTGISGWTIRNWKIKRQAPNIYDICLCFTALDLNVSVTKRYYKHDDSESTKAKETMPTGKNLTVLHAHTDIGRVSRRAIRKHDSTLCGYCGQDIK